jgi:hypothetical protein
MQRPTRRVAGAHTGNDPGNVGSGAAPGNGNMNIIYIYIIK